MDSARIEWRDADRLAEFLHNNPAQALEALASLLSQEQAHALHDLAFPPSTDVEKAAVVEDVLKQLRRVGYADNAPPLTWAAQELVTLKPQPVDAV